MNRPLLHKAHMRIKFSSTEKARMICDCLNVDDELQPTKVSKALEVDDSFLIVSFASSELKVLRVTMSSFFDMILVATKTLLEFDES
mmetsp:Transcript_33857/g.34492  ORF Transcript_33857/g.34492 Transcript_33857/m.34492 type:complete len:87 (+) Transcript_33857:458-718(+)